MNRPDKANTADLLIELGCEELPPKSLPILAKTLFDGFTSELNKAELEFDTATSHFYYTPRRLALLISASDGFSSDVDSIL